MSLYNMVCGNNPLYNLYLAMIGVEFDSIPRFRDVWVKMEGDKPLVVIHTRTGGGNREGYLIENAGLTRNENYLFDCDDSFDSTFADFTYRVPEKYLLRVAELQSLLANHSKFQSPRQKFDRAMAGLEGKGEQQEPLPEANMNRAAELIEELAVELGLVSKTEPVSEASQRSTASAEGKGEQ
jgi:hypothetical protein